MSTRLLHNNLSGDKSLRPGYIVRICSSLFVLRETESLPPDDTISTTHVQNELYL